MLRAEREAVVASLVALADDPGMAARVPRLSERQLPVIADNAALREAPTMPAIDRYTGVLFDALSADTLDTAARRWLGTHALIHTAPFGPVGALDPIPGYRLAAGTALPGVPPLRRHWAEAVSTALTETPQPVIDLRSEAYVALGPVPSGLDSTYVRVVSDGPDGATRALNHFNKKAKGELVRRLAVDRPGLSSVDDLIAWAGTAGLSMRARTHHGRNRTETELVV